MDDVKIDAIDTIDAINISSIEYEMLGAVHHFLQSHNIFEYDTNYIQKFIIKTRHRRSIKVLNKDLIFNICKYCNIRETFKLLRTCKKYAKYINCLFIWKLFVKEYYPNSKMSLTDVDYIKRNCAIHIFHSMLDDLPCLRDFCFEIMTYEENLIKLENENEQISKNIERKLDLTQQTKWRYDTNKKEIESLQKLLKEYKDKMVIRSYENQYIDLMYSFTWVCPSKKKYLCEMPKVIDDDLDKNFKNISHIHSESDSELSDYSD